MTSDPDHGGLGLLEERRSGIVTAAHLLPSRPLTLDDVTRLAENDDRHRYELSEGNLIVVPRADTWRHQEISAPGVQTADDGLNGRIP